MTTTKPVNPGQLQRETVAIGGAHISVTLLGPVDSSTGIAPAGATLLCSDMAGSSSTESPCAACVTAYNAHVAVANNLIPTVTPGAQAGTGATATLVSGSDDLLTVVTAVAGTTPAAGEAVRVTFGAPRTNAPLVVQVGALNVAAGTLYAANITATGYSILTQSAPVAGRSYTLWGHVVG